MTVAAERASFPHIPCSHSIHARLKLDVNAWSALEWVGLQRCCQGWLELRNCVCGSTLSVRRERPAEPVSR